MIRVLHLLGREAEFQTARGSAALARGVGDGFSFHSHTLGAGGDDRNPLSAFITLRRGADEKFDLVHAWDAASLAASALAGVAPIVYTPCRFPTRRSVGWLRAVMGYRDVQVICSSATQHRAYVERGIPVERCHLIRPGVDFSLVKRRRDASLRAAMGFGEDDVVILAAGESTRAAGHRLAVWTTAILHVLDGRYRILLWGRGDQAGSVARLAEKQGQEGLISVAERRLGRRLEFEELLPAADLVLVTANGPVPTLPIAICMAAGLPIVSTVTYTVAELLEDRHTAVMVPRPAPRVLAQRVLELRQDPSLQWTIVDMARTEAYEFFALTRFVEQYRTVYRQIAAGEKVEVVESSPGVGTRFHGRG
ncbi:MAG TPA: glycosyltransferase [Tepidisphaeraceae bacterium]|jgi:glycosyltransferase involved in cell wall biosynthesis|nr:glycosyltransferase [Tepidisphaeraceae bacterium]